jgi:hypothetical protein
LAAGHNREGDLAAVEQHAQPHNSRYYRHTENHALIAQIVAGAYIPPAAVAMLGVLRRTEVQHSARTAEFALDERRKEHRADEAEPVAWRPKRWRHLVGGMSTSRFYKERNAGRIATVKCGSATLVTTSPRDYIAALGTMTD